MDKKSLIATIIFLIIVVISVSLTYYKYISLENVPIETDEEAFQAALLEE